MKKTYSRLFIVGLMLVSLATSIFAATYVAHTPTEFYQHMETAFFAQETEFSIDYQGERSHLLGSLPVNLANLQRQMLASQEIAADNGGYLALNLDNGSTTRLNSDYNFKGMTYLSTPQELAYVAEEAQRIVASMDLSQASDMVKIKTIYEYMTNNFTYDDSLTRFSAYDGLMDGTMVCQGYALLLSQLLWAANVENAMMTGQSQDQNHAWNIVELDGLWYYLDSTWDGASQANDLGSWDYFLKGTDDFPDHTPFSSFTSADYQTDHPMAQTSYPLPTVSILLDGEPLGALIIRTTSEPVFSVQYPQGYEDASVIWTVGDDAILSLEGGVLRGLTTGKSWVQLELDGHPEVFPQRLSVEVVDMTTVSPWASQTVTDYYLGQMLPASLCADYQAAMTRSELARLVDNLILKTTGYGSFGVVNAFADIDDCPDAFSILRCNAAGILNGKSATEFAPDDQVSRQEMAAVLLRTADFIQTTLTVQETVTEFTDEAAIASWALENVLDAQKYGLMQGNTHGQFLPQDTITREECVITLSRIVAGWVG